ncbi:hypothetical protein GR160_12770 [Flavobacterium sp. Sd200]|uniref:DUF6252 family protein n=1 Tax=Flavobacterium sp. Sd200 TaxID=2692211 RepID=UPI00136E626C|nr:DUF6252 family protein [Flavobacterium sp. Sd200]MXN92099.1 hypothetical protein [Flavobacterium sp. Sd200]
MKSLKSTLLLLFFAIAITGCSSEDVNVVGDDVSGDTFSYTQDGQLIPVTNIVAQKSEDLIAVTAFNSDGQTIVVQFNKYGNLREVMTYDVSDLTVPGRTSYHYYKSNYFNFELVSLDETAKTVSVTFSGKLYNDKYDITSDFSTVDGTFTVSYMDVTPQIPGMQVSAKINGTQWRATETGDSSGGFFSEDNITLYASNDSPYTISTIINHEYTEVGTYNFTNSSASNKLELSVFETETLNDISFATTSGTLKITGKTVGALTTTIEGTFSFTAFNPFTQTSIRVTDGVFKRVYINY